MKERFAALGNFGACPNPPKFVSATCNRLTAASSKIDFSILPPSETLSYFERFDMNCSAEFPTSFGFSFQA